jgi:nucleoside-diphosphate-sugar epimerase
VSTVSKPAVIVTGVSGNLGSRLLSLLDDFEVIGIDLSPARASLPARFENVDLGRESACRQLVQIIKQSKTRAVVHLAFAMPSAHTNALDSERMWQINVAGTARVMEAITECNRHGSTLDTFIYPSSAWVYGPETPGPVKETHSLGAHSLPFAIHKQEADDVIRFRAESLGDCSTYILRAQTFGGAGVQNYMMDALRGIPTGGSKRAARMRTEADDYPSSFLECNVSKNVFSLSTSMT